MSYRWEATSSNILLVEDDPDDRELTLLAFQQAQVANPIHVCSDGVEALDYLQQSGPGAQNLPALVLLDLKLPKIDGIGVLKRIRSDARTRRLPVVILSSSLEERDLLAGYDNYANGYVRKPLNFLSFVEAARRIALYWLALNEPPP